MKPAKSLRSKGCVARVKTSAPDASNTAEPGLPKKRRVQPSNDVVPEVENGDRNSGEALEQGKENLKSLTSSLETVTHGFSAAVNKTSYSHWIRHPLSAFDNQWSRVCVNINSTCTRMEVWCEWSSNSYPSAPCAIESPFIWILSLKVMSRSQSRDERERMSLRCKTVWMPPNEKREYTEFDVKSVTSSETFFVSFRLSILKDSEICKAFLVQKKPLNPCAPRLFATVVDQGCWEKREKTDVIVKPLDPCARQMSAPVVNQGLWENREKTDLIVKPADGAEIHVHSLVLMESSPVFKAMLTHDTMEKHTGKWIVWDVPHDVMSQMLQFVYLETLTTSDMQVLLQLLEIAHRYDLPRLTTATEDILVGKLASESLLGVTLLPVAHKWNLEKLKRASEGVLMTIMEDDSLADFILATNCSAQRLQRLAAAHLLSQSTLPPQEESWDSLESAYPELAEFVLDMYFDYRNNFTFPADFYAPQK